jgi:hypothetical protein
MNKRHKKAVDFEKCIETLEKKRMRSAKCVNMTVQHMKEETNQQGSSPGEDVEKMSRSRLFLFTDILNWQQSTMFQADSYTPERVWRDIELHLSVAFGNFVLLISKTGKNRVSGHFPDVWFDALRSLSGQKFKVVDVSLQGDHCAMVTISFSST